MVFESATDVSGLLLQQIPTNFLPSKKILLVAQCLFTSVADPDPDPYVFGHPGS
jgi:hypothetical protein